MSDHRRSECVNANCRMQFPLIGGIEFKFCPSCGCRQDTQVFKDETDGPGTPSDNASRNGVSFDQSDVNQSTDQSASLEGLREKASVNPSENPQGISGNGVVSLRPAVSAQEPATVVRPPSRVHRSTVDTGKALVAGEYGIDHTNKSQTTALDVDVSSTHTSEHQEGNKEISSLNRDDTSEKSAAVSEIKDTAVKTSSSLTSKDQVCCFVHRLFSIVSRSIDRIINMQ